MATPGNTPTAKVGTLGLGTAVAAAPTKSQRGQNKPKCKQCGNVARSRCPYECCKSCCARNQNPCPIHVLKANSSFPDKSPSSGATQLDQQSFEPPSSVAGRVASLRQLSNSFAQFNNLNLSLRSKKPLTGKDVAAINEWRFSKLKEYKERNTVVENEAFDRYMQNVDLLEEVLSVKHSDDTLSSSASESNPTPTKNDDKMIPGLKLHLRSNLTRDDGARMRIKKLVDEKLKKLQKFAVDAAINEAIDEADKDSKKRKRTEMLSSIGDLLDKINKARSEEDLRSCLEMKFQLFNSDEDSSMVQLSDNEMQDNQTAESDNAAAKELDYSVPKLVATNEIDQETLNTIDSHFSSLVDVEML